MSDWVSQGGTYNVSSVDESDGTGLVEANACPCSPYFDECNGEVESVEC